MVYEIIASFTSSISDLLEKTRGDSTLTHWCSLLQTSSLRLACIYLHSSIIFYPSFTKQKESQSDGFVFMSLWKNLNSLSLSLSLSLSWCVSHPAYFSNYVLQSARLLEENYFLPDPLKSIWNIFQKVYKTQSRLYGLCSHISVESVSYSLKSKGVLMSYTPKDKPSSIVLWSPWDLKPLYRV